jgi:tetratricopeptide (TPR) repeat protein
MTVFERIAKVNPVAGAAVILIGAAAWFHPAVAGSDLWWHLATGREMSRTGGIPHADPFSHTFAGRPWMNHEWLWEVIYWRVYQLHPDAVACLNFAVIGVAFGLAAWLAWRASGSLLATGLTIWIAAAACHWYLDIRPHVFSLVLVGFLLVTREKRWAPWIWPPLFAVWVNLHGGFVFGFGLVGLWVLFRTGSASLEARRLVIPRAEWIGLAIAGIAILANPYGYRILEYPLAYLDSSSRFRSLIEWRPPGFGLDPRNFEGRFTLIALAAALGIPTALRRAPYLLALSGVTFLMAFTSRRFIPLFAITSAPVAALGLAAIERWARARWPVLGRREVASGVTIAGLVVALLFWQGVRFFPSPLYRWTQSQLYPRGAVQYLAALPSPPERLFNLYNWGGYLMLHAPGIPVFIDGRANTIYDEQIYDDYGHAYGGGQATRQILRKYDVDAVLAAPSAGVLRVLLEGPDAWKVVYADPQAVLALPAAAADRLDPLPRADRVLKGTPGLALLRAKAALLRGNYGRAREEYEEAVRMDPLLIPAYGGLLWLAGRENDRDALDRWTRVGLKAFPREGSRIYFHRAGALQSMGDLEGTIEALRRATPRGPFRNRAGHEKRIRSLERRLRRDGGGTGR